MLVNSYGDTLKIRAIKPDGTVMDSLTLTRICGDANNDGEITIEDAVFLANYFFSGGPEPIHISTCDVNGDGEVNFEDVLYLMNYLTGGGPPLNAYSKLANWRQVLHFEF